MEVVAALAFLLIIGLSWVNVAAGWLGSIGLIVAIAHHARLILIKPWLALAAAAEGLAVYVLYLSVVREVVPVPNFEALCIFVFLLRYWQRAEREVTARVLSLARGEQAKCG